MKFSERKYHKMIEYLKTRKDNRVLSTDGKKVYVLTKESDGTTDAVAVLESDVKLTFMPDEELDQFITEKLKEG